MLEYTLQSHHAIIIKQINTMGGTNNMNDNELLLAISNLFNENLKPINDRFNIIKNIVKDIQLTLENETNRNIRIIAEGHLDLSRKLDEALKVENEKKCFYFVLIF